MKIREIRGELSLGRPEYLRPFNYIEAVLPKLVEVGTTGAILWCYADYIPELYDRSPCKESKHERFFGPVRPDGSLKPHAEVVKHFTG